MLLIGIRVVRVEGWCFLIEMGVSIFLFFSFLFRAGIQMVLDCYCLHPGFKSMDIIGFTRRSGI